MNLLATTALILLLFQGPPTGTATISGRVVRVGTNEPVAGAQITLGQGPILASAQIPPVVTDSNGTFVFTGLEPGSYVAMSRKTGYAAQLYGALQPGMTGNAGVAGTTLSEMATTITLEAGKAVGDIEFQLTPAAVISGRLLGASGEPLVGILIQLLPTFYDGTGRRPMSSLSRTGTDDRGEFRIFNVEPGRYYLSANWTPGASIQQEPGGPIVGIISGNPTNRRYVATYYPGVTDLDRAVVIDIKSGEERKDLSFSMIPGSLQTFQIRGRFIDGSTGQPPSVQGVLSHGVQLFSRNADFLNNLPTSDPHLNADGTFEIRDVQPGQYWLHVQSSPPMVRPVDPEQAPIPPSVVAAIPVDIVAQSIEGLIVTMVPSTTVSGGVHADEQELSAIDGWDRIRVQLQVIRVGTTPMNMMGDPKASALQADGTFAAEKVNAGEYRLTISGLPSGVYVKKAQFGGVDALNHTFPIAGPSSNALDIVISARTGQIRGLVSDSGAKPAANAQVVLIPDSRNSRPDLYRTAKSAVDGRFTISGIAPGDYRLFAWEELRRFEYFDPELLRLSESQGKVIHIEEVSSESADVTLIQHPQ